MRNNYKRKNSGVNISSASFHAQIFMRKNPCAKISAQISMRKNPCANFHAQKSMRNFLCGSLTSANFQAQASHSQKATDVSNGLTRVKFPERNLRFCKTGTERNAQKRNSRNGTEPNAGSGSAELFGTFLSKKLKLFLMFFNLENLSIRNFY